VTAGCCPCAPGAAAGSASASLPLRLVLPLPLPLPANRETRLRWYGVRPGELGCPDGRAARLLVLDGRQDPKLNRPAP
jgi:hypothetical protein